LDHRHFRRLLTLLALSAAVIAACSGETPGARTSGDGGNDATSIDGGDAMAIVPDAFAATSIQPGTSGVCSFAQQTAVIDVGVPTGSPPDTVSNGGSQAGAQVNVDCTVHPDNSGYDIDLNVEVVGQGAMHVYSTVAGAVASSGATGISATFSKSVGGSAQSFSATDCTLTYMYQLAPVPNPMPVAPGRIWAHVSCPDAQTMVDVLLPDGGRVPEQCDVEADFLFENCTK
jgi:hypothetical protein